MTISTVGWVCKSTCNLLMTHVPLLFVGLSQVTAQLLGHATICGGHHDKYWGPEPKRTGYIEGILKVYLPAKCQIHLYWLAVCIPQKSQCGYGSIPIDTFLVG